ncbi:HET-domain-containing protein [Nemania sp. FL0916]|nr:HET-domain-containing protein [Nemania sp. FL0916]
MSFQVSLYRSNQPTFPGVRFFLLQQTSLPYRYLPLKGDGIRLIELHPECDGRDLSVTFIYTSVREAAGTYEALSYTWGSAAELHVLLCDDSHLKITKSLQSALSDLRLESARRRLWVDAICTNQRDLVERGSQVILMDQIYRNASKTIVHLGEKSADSELAARYLENHMWRVRGAIANFINRGGIAQDTAEMMQICIKSLGTSQAKLFEDFDQRAVQTALMNLLSRPWFRRAWVIQEFVVSPNVDMYCGKTMCEWGSFSMMFYYSFVEAKIMQMHELRNNYHSKDENRPQYKNLPSLLSRCRTAEATLSIDKIFALLNLCVSSHKPEPVYLKSKAEVYRDFAESAIKDGDGKTILTEAALTNRADSALPSWVPDWSETPSRICLSQVVIASDGLFFDASGSRKTAGERLKPSFHVDGNVLFVKGVFIGGIAVGHDRPIPGMTADEAPNLNNLLTILSYIKWFLDMEGDYPTGEDKAEVVSILLEADQRKGPTNITSFWENTHSRDLLFEPELASTGAGAEPVPESMRKRRVEDPQGYANISRAVAGRRFAITEHSYIGLVPDKATDGDKLCIIQGCNVPFVLRQVGDCYSLIGDAYIHGIMMGEFFELNPEMNDAMIEIPIC